MTPSNAPVDGPMLIAGSGRSGTTWVLDVVAQAGRLRTVFEPLHPAALAAAAPYANRYLPPDARHHDLEELLRQAFDGRLDSVWSNYRVRPDRLRPSLAKLTSARESYRMLRRWKKLWRHYRRYGPARARPGVIVKAIRANLMLAWIRQAFDARILLVLRHPGAVVESQLRLGGPDWSPERKLQRFREDEALLAQHGDRYADLLAQSLSPAAGLTLIWCIQNLTPLAELGESRARVVFYERLFSAPQEEWRRALAAFGIGGEPDWDLVARPSEQASGLSRSARQVDASHLGRWLERVDGGVLSEIDAVLQQLGVTIYAANEPLPRHSAAFPDERAHTA